MWLCLRQENISWENKDYTYIDLYKKSYEYERDPETKRINRFYALRGEEARRDYHTGSLKSINHLIQFDKEPNLDLKEVRLEIYKITVSFEPNGKFVLKTKAYY